MRKTQRRSDMGCHGKPLLWSDGGPSKHIRRRGEESRGASARPWSLVSLLPGCGPSPGGRAGGLVGTRPLFRVRLLDADQGVLLGAVRAEVDQDARLLERQVEEARLVDDALAVAD